MTDYNKISLNAVRGLYDTLRGDDSFSVTSDYAKWRNWFLGHGQSDGGYAARKSVFDALHGAGYEVGQNYEEFRNYTIASDAKAPMRYTKMAVQKPSSSSPAQQQRQRTQVAQQQAQPQQPQRGKLLMQESAVKSVYDKLKQTGDARGTYEQFKQNFVGPGVDKYHNRLNVYRQLKAAGANVPGTYEEFVNQYMTTPASSSAPQQGMSMNEMQMWAADAQGNVQGMMNQGKSFVDGLRASVARPLDYNRTTLGGANMSNLGGVTKVGEHQFRTQYGNVYDNIMDASAEQNAARIAQSDNAAYSKIAELDKQIDDLQKQADEERKRIYPGNDALHAKSAFEAMYSPSAQGFGSMRKDAKHEELLQRIGELKSHRAMLLRGTQFGADLNQSIDVRLAQINQALREKYKTLKPSNGYLLRRDQSGQNLGEYVRNQNLIGASRYLTDAKKMMSEAEAGSHDPNNLNGFFRGAKRGLRDGLVDVRTWDMGFTDWNDEQAYRSVAQKWDRGENLSYDEQALLDAMATKLSVDAYFASGLGRGYKAGKVTAESLPFMIEMLVNPASATGKSMQAIVARYALKKFGRQGLKNVGKYATSSSMKLFKTALSKSAPSALRKAAAKQFTARAVTRAGGDVLGSMAMSATTGQVRVLADALNRMTGQARWRVNDQGLVKYDGHDDPEETSMFKAYTKAFFANTIQNHSEMVSAYIPYVGQLLKAGFGRMAGREVTRLLGRAKAASVRAFNKLPKADMIADLTHNLTHNQYVDIANGIRKRANIGGPIDEYLEEVIGNVETAIVTGDMDFSTEQGKGVFNLSDNIDTFLGVSLMTGAFSVFGAAGYRTPHYRAVKALQRADEAGKRLYEGNEGAWEELKQDLDECKTQNERNSVLMTAFGSRASEAQKKAVVDYVRASQFLEGVNNGTYAKMQEEAEHDDEFGTRRGCINSYIDGQNLTDSQSRREALIDYNAKHKRALALEPDAEFYDSPELYDSLNPNASEEQRKAVSEYAQSKAKVDGINDAIEGRYQHVTSSIENQVGRIANTKSGNIIEVELEGRHGKYYVRSGNISVNPEGYVNHASSDRTVVFVDEYGFPVAGNMDASTIEGKVEITNAQSVIDGVKSKAEAIREAEYNAMNGRLSFAPGSSFNIMDDTGEQHKASIIQDEQGNAVVQMDGAEGVLPLTDDVKATLQSKADMWQQMNYEGLVQQQEEAKAKADAEAEGTPTPSEEAVSPAPSSAPTTELQQDQAVAFTDADGNVHEGRVNGETADGGWEIEFDDVAPNGKGNVDSYTADELKSLGIAPIVDSEAAEAAPTTSNVESEAASTEEGSSSDNQPSETQRSEAKTAPSTPSTSSETSNVESQPRAIDRIPTDDQGQHLYEKAPIEDTAAALIEQMHGDVDEAIETAKVMQRQMQGKAKRAAKRIEDINDGKVEASVDEIIQAKNSANLIGQNMKYWEDVVKFLEDVKRGEEVKAEEEAEAEANEAAPAEEASEEKKQDGAKEYSYQLQVRPYGIGSQPDGCLRHVDDGSRFGSVVYDHPLSEEEVRNFSLVPVTEAKALEGKSFEVPFGEETDVYHIDKVDDNGTIHFHVNDEKTRTARYHELLNEMGDEAREVGTEKHSERAEDAAGEAQAGSEAQQTAEEQKPSETKPKQPVDPDANLRADIRAARDMAKMMFPDVNPELLDKIARDLNQQPLTREQRSQMERIAKAFGLRIRWFKTMPQNGTYSSEKGVICIATDSWHQLSDTFGHEMTHALKDVDMEAYNRLKQAVIEASARNEAERKGLQMYVDAKYSHYKAKDRWEEFVSDEIGATICSRNLADKILFNLDHKVLGRMRDIVKRMTAAVSDFGFNTENKVRNLLHMDERVRDERVPSALDKLQGAIMDAYRMAQKTELARRAEEKRKAEEEKKKEEERKKAEEKRKKLAQEVHNTMSTGVESPDGKGNTTAKYSTRAQVTGAGLTPIEDDGHGNFAILGSDGKVFDHEHPITAEYLKNQTNNPLYYLTRDALACKATTQANVDMVYDKYASLLNAYLEKGAKENGGFENLKDYWNYVGESVYKAVATNSDSQYSYSIDITRVCKKNEAVIDGISEMQKRLGYGITPGQIMELYLETDKQGYQTPCPVCYVFSRYIRNGKYATIMINGQNKYGHLLVDPKTLSPKEKEERVQFWLGEMEKVDAENENNKKAISRANKEITECLNEIDKLSWQITHSKGMKKEELDALKSRVKVMDNRYRAAMNVVSQSSLGSWIKNFAIHKVKVDGKEKWVLYDDTYQGFPKEAALDFKRTAEVMRKYPAIQRYRNSRGAAAGKEITFAADNAVGDVPLALGSQAKTKELAKPREISEQEWEELKAADEYAEKMLGAQNAYVAASQAKTKTARKKLLDAAKKRFISAHIYAQQQSLRGGQRMWSWSDNIESLSNDVGLNLMQLSLLGGALQSYTKQLEGAELVASMNGYVNGSLMGRGNGIREVHPDEIEYVEGVPFVKGEQTTVKDKHGRERVLRSLVYQNVLDGKYYTLVFDNKVGIEPFSHVGEDGKRKLGLFDLNAQYDRAGNILVGMNDIHVRAAMADPRIFFIIPWHSSGANNHILAQMYNVLGVPFDRGESTDYTDVQEEKRISDKEDEDEVEEVLNEDTGEMEQVAKPKKPRVSEHLRNYWEDHYNNKHDYGGRQIAGRDFRCGIEGGVKSSDEVGDKLSESQLHYRELRKAIFTGIKVLVGKTKGGKNQYKVYDVKDYNPEWYKEIMNDEFLSQVYNEVHDKVDSGFMTSTDDKFIYPYEYWDKSSTYETADVNTARYQEYCRRLGHKPKFCGMLDGRPAERDHGNFLDDKGAWKLLIDRRMYDVDGKFQDLTPVTPDGFNTDLIDHDKTSEKYDVTRVADLEATQGIVDNVLKHEDDRVGGRLSVDYGMDLQGAVDAYEKASADDEGVKRSEREAWKDPATMSDEEKAARGNKLMNAHAINVTSKQIVKTEDKSARVVAEEWWKDNVGDEPLNYNTEIGDVEIDEHSIGDSLSHRYGQAKLDAITSLKDGFNNAVYLGTMPDFTRTANDVHNHYFAYPIIYDGKRNYVFCRAMEDYNKNRLYVHEVFLAENIQKEGNTLQTAAREPHGGIALYKSILANVLDVANVANNSDTRQESSEENEGRGTKFSLRTKPAPKKTQKVYKLMRLGEDGKLYPLFIGSNDVIELLKWYDADSPKLKDLKSLSSHDYVGTETHEVNGEKITETFYYGAHLVDNETGEAISLAQFKAERNAEGDKRFSRMGKNPNPAAIDWATEHGCRWIQVREKKNAQRRYGGEMKSYYNYGINGSKGVSVFAMRPGWHAGSLPTMRQIGKGRGKNLRDDRFVWVEGEVPADIDYNAEAQQNPDKDIPDHIPEDGFYMKATNADKVKSQADLMGWYVAGSFKANRIISDAEARSIIDKFNKEHGLTEEHRVEYDYEREGGVPFSEKDAKRVNRQNGTKEQKRVPTSSERALRDGLVERLREAGLGVSLSEEEGQRVLDLVNGGAREMRVYHGSGADFDHFDLSHIGEGTGAQIHGYGVYLTKNRSDAHEYALETRKSAKDFTFDGEDFDKEELLDRLTEDYGHDRNARRILSSFLNDLSDMPYYRAEEEFRNTIREYESYGDTDLVECLNNALSGVRYEPGDERPDTFVYSVEIPKDNGRNYLDRFHKYDGKAIKSIANRMAKVDSKFPIKELAEELKGMAEKGEALTGGKIYNLISNRCNGSDKAASHVLSQMGYVGIKYNPLAGYVANNYVIFNEEDLQIIDRVRLFRGKGGEAYGFTVDGKIYIDPKHVNAETPIHEYAHLWATALQQKDSKAWGDVVRLMKDTGIWDSVRENYPELKTDDEIADEVLATYSGQRGAERLREEMRQVMQGEGRMVDKVDALSAMERVRNAIARFWRKVAEMLGIRYTKAEDVADHVLGDLLDRVNPNVGVKSDAKAREQFIGEQGAASIDHAEEVSTRMDNLGVARQMEADKKDAKTIKMATGWERGADGKWRYEVPDIKLKPMDEWLNKRKKFTLADIVEENDPILEMYPKLKEIKIEKNSNPYEYGASYYDSERCIKLPFGGLRNLLESGRNEWWALNSFHGTLIHEVQHAIQHEEGFAHGGSPETLSPDMPKEVMDEYRSEWDEFVSLANRYNELCLSYNNKTSDIKVEDLDNLRDEALSHRDKANAIKSQYKLGKDGYNRLSGEVEARNVEKRMDMTPEERRKSLAFETEDVAREDQIFLGVKNDGEAKESKRMNDSTYGQSISHNVREGVDGLQGRLSEMKDAKEVDAVKAAIRKEGDAAWKEANRKNVRIAEMLCDERKAELEGNGPAEKFSLRDGSFIRSGSYFSGGGLLEEGLKNYLDPRVAVEFNEKIAGVYADNFGRHIVTADVRNVDPRELTAHVDGSVEYFHASPVCKNFSRAKREAGEVELDKETAQSTADFIRANRPRVVTIENVKGYRGSDALKIITDALTEEGYDWDADVYNTGDFGGYTKRERLIVRAVRDGKLPEKPKPLPRSERKGGWMEAVSDLMDSLPEKRSGVPEWMDKRLKAMGIDWRHIDKPLYVLGQGDAADKVSHAFADELLPTLRTKGGDVIIMPDGRVLRATPRVLARVTGLADDYKMPVTDDMAHTIVGNGIPSQLSEHVVGPLLEHVFNGGERITHDMKESRRVSGRLANTGNTSSVAQRIYEEAVRGRAFEIDEAWHDSLASVKALQDALAKERGVDIRDLENVYLHLVHLSSVSAAEMTEYRNKQVENLLDAMNAILKDKTLTIEDEDGKKHRLTEMDVETYLNCKHAIERNEHIARKKAKAEAEEKYADDLKKLNAAWAKAAKDWNDHPIQQTKDAMDKALKELQDKEKERDDYENSQYDKHRKNDDYSGLTAIFDDPKHPTMTNEELEDKARDLVADMEQNIGWKRIDDLWDAINDATLFSLHKSYKSGLISKETYNEVKDMYEWYVPLRGFAEDTASDVYEYMEHAEPKTQQELKNAKGRTSRSDGILANIMNMGSSAILHGNQNLAKQKLLNLAMNSRSSLLSLNTAFYKPSNKMDAKGNPYDELVQIPDYILNEDDADVRRQLMEQWTQQMEADPDVKTKFDKLNLDYRTLYGVQNEHAVSVFRGGKQYMVYVNGNPRAAQAINGTNIVRHDGALSKSMAKVTRWMSQMMTSYNPSFVTSNAQRDFTSALLISQAKYGAGYTARFANNVRTVFPFLFSQINWGKKQEFFGMYQLYMKYKNDLLDMDKPIEKYFSEFMANGGETGYTQSVSVDEYKDFIEKELKDRRRNKVVRFGKKPFGAFMGFVEELNRGIENACRFAAYMTSRETGRSVLQSVQDAKEVSTNFNLHGSGALGNAFFRDAYAFVNPAVQSVVQYWQLTKQNPKAMGIMAATTISLGVLSTWLLSSMVGPLGGGDGDDDKDEGDPKSDYWNINPYTRRNYLLIPIPNGKGNWMKIAMAPEIRALYGVGVLAAEYMLGRTEASDCAVGIMDQLNQLMPKQFFEPTETFKKDDGQDYTIGKQVFTNMMPTSWEPIWRSFIINRDFMGKQITNQSDWNQMQPEWQRASYNTSEWLVNTSKWLNNVSRGNEYGAKGYLNFNPSRWGYLAYSYFGGIGQLYDQGRGLFKGVVQQDEEFDERLRYVPVINRMFTTTNNEYNKYQDSNDRFQYYESVHNLQDYMFRNGQRMVKEGTKSRYEVLGDLWTDPDYNRGLLMDYGHWLKQIDKLKQLRKATNDEQKQREYSHQINEVRKNAVRTIMYIEEHGGLDKVNEVSAGYRGVKNDDQVKAINEKRDAALKQVIGEAMKKYPNPFPFNNSELQKDDDKKDDK